MAPVEPDLFLSDLKAIAVFAGYFMTAAWLTALIVYRNVYVAYRTLPPSQATRTASSNRAKYMKLFAGLAAISLAVRWCHLYRYLVLSYRVWAHHMDEPLPTGLWTRRGILGQEPTGLALGRWLQDTPLFVDAWEIVTEQSRRFWWSQQIFLLAAPWSIFMGVEGRRRKIHHLWAFVLLGHVVAMSFAMNLFFLAVILTPLPLTRQLRTSTSAAKPTSHRRRATISPPIVSLINSTQKPLNNLSTFFTRVIQPYLLPPLITPHPPTWTPHPLIYTTIFLPIFYLCTFLTPFSTSTPSFLPFLLSLHTLPFLPLYIDHLVPIAFGSTRIRHRSYLGVWRFMAAASSLLYLKQSLVALLDNDPGAHSHRHSTYLAYLHLTHPRQRSALNRSTSAAGRVFGALGDHPAVAVVGSDVLLCAFSLAAWSVIRGIEVQMIGEAIGASVVTATEPRSSPESNPDPSSSAEKEITAHTATTTTTIKPRGRRGRKPSRKAIVAPAPTAGGHGDEVKQNYDHDHDHEHDHNHHPGYCAPDPGGDDISGAAVAVAVPGAAKPEAEAEAGTGTGAKNSDGELNYEAGAVTWAIFSLGGLGSMATGVLGAEAERVI